MLSRPRAPSLHATLAALGVLATLLAAVTFVTSLALHVGPHAGPFAAVAACRGFLATHATLGWALVGGLGALVATVAMRAARAVRRHRRASSRSRAALARARACTLLGREAHLLDDPRPLAFCAGLLRPRVYVSQGALDGLGRDELLALLAHEAHHARRRDPLRRVLADVLAESLFFLPVLRPLGERRAALAELRADAAAVAACGGDVRALAGALLSFEQADLGAAHGVDPERVDRLAGLPTGWTPPLAPLLAAFAALAGVLAVPLFAVEHATGAALDLTAFGVSVCVAALVALPLLAAAAAPAVTAVLRDRRSTLTP
ncbi:M56 family metallopeptidase [Conexibacter woesei]|uniref:Peptidase M48 Ste24p n=1 Tax=Conexibacter woesei (strain DSM 14684 / CCUG 47730 / CIP 108061 / JCM 11494 / NBRC 100937 / ID131577) TaxID=469383 RepID=D3F7P2_CONWI|nr:M56 family metallopeptidase [Conexibacter woesei]ADB50904.1 peptidase M48 Ste24p [Conexibacter woesei DSM 14684]